MLLSCRYIEEQCVHKKVGTSTIHASSAETIYYSISVVNGETRIVRQCCNSKKDTYVV